MVELVLSQMCVNVLSHMEEPPVQTVSSMNYYDMYSHYIMFVLVVCNNHFCANGGTCEVSNVGLTCRWVETS